MHKSRLEEITKKANETVILGAGIFPAEWIRDMRWHALDLVDEVTRLNARLKDVRAVVDEPAKYGDDVPAQRVLEAVEGHRAATLEELRGKILGGVSDDALDKWIDDGKARVTSDGRMIIDDLTGLAMEVLREDQRTSL